MSTGSYRARLDGVGVTAVASLELLLRSLADVVPLLPDFVAAGIALVVPFVSERSLQAWLVGWLFLGLLAYGACRRMDAIRIDGADPVPFRRSLAIGAAGLAVGFGVTVKQQVFAVAFGHGSVPSPVAENVFLLLAGSWLFYLACTVPVVAVERRRGGSATLKTSLGLLVYESPRTLFLGPSLAIAATLYPLPEVAVVTWLVAIVGVNTVPFGPQIRAVLNDPVERLVIGAAAARRELQGYVTLLYAFAGLTYSLAVVIGSEGTTRSILLELFRNVGTYSLSAVFFVVCIFGPAAYGFWYWLRLVERLPFEFDVLDPAGTNSAGPGSAESVGSVEYRSLPPAFGIPVSLLFLPLGIYITAVGSDSIPRPIPLGYVLFACLVAGVALLSVVRTRKREPRERFSVQIVAPVSLALQLALFVLMGAEPIARIGHGILTANAVGPVGWGVLAAVGESALFAGLLLLPALVPVMIRSESTLLKVVGLYAATFVAAIIVYLLGGFSDGAAEVAGLLLVGAPLVWFGVLYVADALELSGAGAAGTSNF